MTETQRAAMQMALEVLENLHGAELRSGLTVRTYTYVTDLRAALAEQDVPATNFGNTEPVAYLYVGGTVFGELDDYDIEDRPGICEALNEASYGYPRKLPLYTAPPRREWQGLTDEQMYAAYESAPMRWDKHTRGLRAIEAALKEKNT